MARHSRVSLLAPLQERILALMLTRPSREWYRSELARELGVPPSSLQRPLAGLVRSGVVVATPDGNRVYYAVDTTHPILPDLKRLVAKTSGVVGVLRDALSSARSRVRLALVYGSVAAGTEGASSDIDLLVVGSARLADLATPLRRAAGKLGREVNTSVYSVHEFVSKLEARNRFLRAVLDKPKLFVIGTANDLEEIAGGNARRRGAVEQG